MQHDGNRIETAGALMAQPQLQAEFFVDGHGIAFPKAPPITSEIRRHIYERDGGVCQKCGKAVARLGNTLSPFKPPPAAVDHILPRARGGQNEDTNLRLLCITCNAQKGAK